MVESRSDGDSDQLSEHGLAMRFSLNSVGAHSCLQQQKLMNEHENKISSAIARKFSTSQFDQLKNLNALRTKAFMRFVDACVCVSECAVRSVNALISLLFESPVVALRMLFLSLSLSRFHSLALCLTHSSLEMPY